MEIFALAAKINTVRMLLSLDANFDWPLQKFDVKNTFLHGELSEQGYMDYPIGYKMLRSHDHEVCILKNHFMDENNHQKCCLENSPNL